MIKNVTFFPISNFKFLLIASVMLSVHLFLFSCKKSTGPVQTGALQLELLDVTCTEAFLGLRFEENYLGKTLQVYRDDSLIVTRPLMAGDTILLAENLWPNTAYAFSAVVTDGNKQPARSEMLSVTTLDTTSHDFTWQTFEFGGQGGSSAFYDVAIIDENDIWAVGEIYTADDQYNAAHWDGEKWELKKIFLNGYFYPIKTIFAFGKNNIWVANLTLIHFNGDKIDFYTTPPLDDNGDAIRINKIWGTSGTDLYVVGNRGMIAHYDGQAWRRIESGTEERINDIYGKYISYKFIYCAVGTLLRQTIPAIIRINETGKAEYLNWPYSSRIPHSVWFDHPGLLFVAGGGIVRKDYRGNWHIINDLPRIYTRRIRGNSPNDIFAAGDFLLLSHFNGMEWKLLELKNDGLYYSLDIKNNLVAVAGEYKRKATVKIGIR